MKNKSAWSAVGDLIWCSERDLNPHDFRHYPLNLELVIIIINFLFTFLAISSILNKLP